MIPNKFAVDWCLLRVDLTPCLSSNDSSHHSGILRHCEFEATDVGGCGFYPLGAKVLEQWTVVTILYVVTSLLLNCIDTEFLEQHSGTSDKIVAYYDLHSSMQS